MKTRIINAAIDVLIRPNTCFANISQNSRYYYTSAVIIFVLAAVSAFFSSILNIWFWSHDGENFLDFSIMPLLLSTSHTLLQNLVLIVAIFWIGKKLDGTTNFKKIFSAISYCLIPASIGAILIPVGMILTTQLFFGGIEVGRNSIDLDPDLSPSYALDYASSTIISYGFLIPFAAWMLILFLKAIQLVNDFDFKKSIITVLLGIVIMYLSQMVFGIPSMLLSFQNFN